MASRDQIYVIETIKAMRKTTARQAYESESDSEIQRTTNRGNKLKKRARFVREGKLGPPTGPAVYKEEIEHAGYRRAIISRNPPLIDEDGYDIDSDDDEQRVQDAVAAAAEADPYSSIRLEQLLAPLPSVTDLSTHPTLSRPFTSTALTELANQGCDLMHKENAALAKVQPLLTRLSGDHTFINCEMFLGVNDRGYFGDKFTSRMLKRKRRASHGGDEDGAPVPNVNDGSIAQPSVNGETGHVTNGVGSRNEQQRTYGEDAMMTDSDEQIAQKPAGETEARKDSTNGGEKASQRLLNEPQPAEKEAPPGTNGDKRQQLEPDQVNGDPAQQDHAKRKGKEPETRPDPGDEEVVMDDGGEQANALPQHNGSRAGSPPPLLEVSFIHPIYLAPESAHPDRDLGLPVNEAEDLRRLIQVYVQKQEEVCRGTRRLYEGLLRADRLRKTVLQWSKAEAHCGPNRDMSDGEDWYDKEEWGLAEELKKGQDEEEEDTTQTQKKTRNRK